MGRQRAAWAPGRGPGSAAGAGPPRRASLRPTDSETGGDGLGQGGRQWLRRLLRVANLSRRYAHDRATPRVSRAVPVSRGRGAAWAYAHPVPGPGPGPAVRLGATKS